MCLSLGSFLSISRLVISIRNNFITSGYTYSCLRCPNTTSRMSVPMNSHSWLLKMRLKYTLWATSCESASKWQIFIRHHCIGRGGESILNRKLSETTKVIITSKILTIQRFVKAPERVPQIFEIFVQNERFHLLSPLIPFPLIVVFLDLSSTQVFSSFVWLLGCPYWCFPVNLNIYRLYKLSVSSFHVIHCCRVFCYYECRSCCIFFGV